MQTLSTTSPRRDRRRAWPHRLVVVVLMLAGAVVTVWPVAETVDGNRQGAVFTTEYVTSIQAASPQQLSSDLKDARAYNAELPAEALDDPWGDDAEQASTAHDHYLRTLGSTKAMGRLRIPAIDVDLPIFHDSDRLSMSYGVGHMYGSSLPAGGADTHAVLAAHTGLRGRTMFDRLPELTLDETFQVDVAGAALTYRIDQIVVVEPWELEAVQRIPGGDYVTLVTCYTPPGEHKQRMLVRGTRVPDAATSTTTTAVASADGPVAFDASVQGWMWPRLAGAAAAAGILTIMVVVWVAGDRRERQAARRIAAGTANVTTPAAPTHAPTRTLAR